MNHASGRMDGWLDEWKDGWRGLDLAAQRVADSGTGCCCTYEDIKKEVVN